MKKKNKIIYQMKKLMNCRHSLLRQTQSSEPPVPSKQTEKNKKDWLPCYTLHRHNRRRWLAYWRHPQVAYRTTPEGQWLEWYWLSLSDLLRWHSCAWPSRIRGRCPRQELQCSFYRNQLRWRQRERHNALKGHSHRCTEEIHAPVTGVTKRTLS